MNEEDLKNTLARVLFGTPEIRNLLDKYLEIEYNRVNREMQHHMELKDFFRSQGYHQALTNLSRLKDRLNAK